MTTNITTHEQALAFNKASIFDALAKHGVATVRVTYDGAGDSGQLNDMEFLDSQGAPFTEPFEGKVACSRQVFGSYNPDTQSYRDDTFQEEESSLVAAVEHVCYHVLGLKHPGYENNEGGQGEFTFDVSNRTLSLHHEDNIMEVEVYEYSF